MHTFLQIVSILIPVLFAITLHEVGHGWVAKQFGDRTAEIQGRLTLNPIAHMDPLGTVLLPVFYSTLVDWFLVGQNLYLLIP